MRRDPRFDIFRVVEHSRADMHDRDAIASRVWMAARKWAILAAS